MQTRTYNATSIEAAMVRARTELGPDALLLKSTKLEKGYEVVFALEEPEIVKPQAPAPAPIPVPVSAPAPPRVAPTPLVSSEFQQLCEQLDEIRAALAQSALASQKASRTIPELANLQARLIACEIDPVLAKDILDRVEASLAVEGVCQRADLQAKSRSAVRMMLNFDYDYIESLTRAELKRRIQIDATIGGRLAVFVGPTGSGKTTSMMKIAMGTGGSLRLMSLDSSPGAREEMKLYAQTYGLDFIPLASPAKLPKMIQSLKDTDLILLDTPGFAAPESPEAVELAAALAQCPQADVFLVVAGYMKAKDLQRTIQRYEKFRFSKLLVTKLDETGALGSVLSEASRAGKSISFLTDGIRIPEDIRAASAEEILNLVLAGAGQLEQTAA